MPVNQNKILHAMLYLCACVLHGHIPETAMISDLDFEELYRKSEYHNMTAIISMALEAGGFYETGGMSPQLMKKWMDGKNRAIRKNMLLDAERQKMFQFMEDKGIWYMPLKGVILKELYPQIGMRQMADNDILYDVTFQGDLKDYMISQNFKVKSVGTGTHDIYVKPPVYYFELHTSLFGEFHKKEWYEYYREIKGKLQKDKGNQYGYHFREEDFYVYMMTHAFKHYMDTGMGIRFLVDCYVYIWKKGAKMDWDYIEGELGKLQLSDYEKTARKLSTKVFAASEDFERKGIDLTAEEDHMLAYSFACGIHGNMQNFVKKNIKELEQDRSSTPRGIKVKYFFRRIFPDMEWFRCFEPFYYKHKYLIPFYYAFRMARGVIFRRRKVREEIRTIRKMK